MRLAAALSILSFCVAATPSSVISQPFPTRPIRVIVPFPPGGAPDQVPRILADKVSASLGQAVVVENRAGASGMIGSESVARSLPDGYTLLHTSAGTLVTPMFLAKNLTYDPVKDFTPITIDIDTTLYLVINPALPVNSMSELLNYAKRYPGKLSYGSSGIGSIYHLSGELIKILTGIDMVHVPYKGSPQTITDLLSGQIMISFGGANILGHVKNGKLKMLALLDSKRYSRTPAIPAITESIPGYHKIASWLSLLGPAGMPAATVLRLQDEFVKAVQLPELRPKFDEAGYVIIGSTADQFAATLRRDIELTGKIVKAANIQPE